jgi:hypothetical protein
LSSPSAFSTKANIRITREGGYRADRVRAYRVILDKKKVATIREAESEELELTPGTHKLQFRIDFCRSRTLELDVKSGDGRLRPLYSCRSTAVEIGMLSPVTESSL